MAEHVTGILANCVDCGYDLRGQQDEPRCPECGRLNIPEAYRQEVRDLVDSGRWFLSSPFPLFAKRPPGWFWSLDRPGDVKRSFRRAAAYVALYTLIVSVAMVGANSFGRTERWSTVTPSDSTTILVDQSQWRSGAFGLTTLSSSTYKAPIDSRLVTTGLHLEEFSFSLTTPSRESRGALTLVYLVGLLAWLLPAYVGLWTQVRQGLPGFAKASATVVAACNYEAHRLLYSAVLVLLLFSTDVVLRASKVMMPWSTRPFAPSTYLLGATLVSIVAINAMASLGWVGALRSDFTRQIVQSRWHAFRIICMYGILLD